MSSPLSDRFALYVPLPLNIEAMNQAAKSLVGTCNFATFGRSPSEISPVRTVSHAYWETVETSLVPLQETKRLLVFTITANGFLRQMVRNIVSSLIEVGKGNWSVEFFDDTLAAKERARSAAAAPPNGLVLEKVDYPDYLELFR